MSFKITMKNREYHSLAEAEADLPIKLNSVLNIDFVHICARCGSDRIKENPKYKTCLKCHYCWDKEN